MKTLAVLVACYNRRFVTISNLSALRQIINNLEGFEAEYFVLDDASPDGTADELAALGADVHVLNGTGHLYWNRGMIAAYRGSLAAGEFDAYLLFNDDVEPKSSGVRCAFKLFESIMSFHSQEVVVGATEDSAGKISYSGFADNYGWRGMRFDRVEPDDSGPLLIDTFNANFVLYPGELFTALGGLDPRFTHSMGDLDLGLRTSRRGHKIWLCPQVVGRCDRGQGLQKAAGRTGFLGSIALELREPNGIRSYAVFVRAHRPRALALILISRHFLAGIARGLRHPRKHR